VGDMNSLEAWRGAKYLDKDRLGADSNVLEMGNKELDKLGGGKARLLEARFIFIGPELV
jgi:hypothetical protein